MKLQNILPSYSKSIKALIIKEFKRVSRVFAISLEMPENTGRVTE